MHLSIPDLQQLQNDNESYTAYNIYIDGFFHCTARYKQLLSLHEQLQAQSSHYRLPPFPPKKFFFLTTTQLEERRVLLEKYLQIVGQNPVWSQSSLLITFLFTAQQETHSIRMHNVDIEIFLMNGYRIPLSVTSTDSTSTILDIVCNHMKIPKELVKHFSLYLFNWSCAKDGQPALKKLENYESPYISQKCVRPEDKIILRKSYWDPCYDLDLMEDMVALDLLYVQTIEDLDLGWMTADSQTQNLLALHKEKSQKKEYMQVAQNLRHYGRIPAGEAVTDGSNISGRAGTMYRVLVSFAGRELTLLSVALPAKEQRYKVTRMKCWRISTLHDDRPQTNGHDGPLIDESNMKLELSFEYLINTDDLKMKWITLKTEHAIFISVCLQSIVDELMRQKHGVPDASRSGQCTLKYLRRDGSTQIIKPSSSGDTLSAVNGNSGSSKEIFSVQRLTEKFASVFFRTGMDCVENNAFEAIGDDEL